jgi:hypothetical protein
MGFVVCKSLARRRSNTSVSSLIECVLSVANSGFAAEKDYMLATKERRMRAILVTFFWVILTGGTLAEPAEAQVKYDFQQIIYPGQTDTQLLAINERGDAVGEGLSEPASYFGFVYSTLRDTVTDIAPVADYEVTRVSGINDAGQIIGFVGDFSSTILRGFVRSKNAVDRVFSVPFASSWTIPRGINNQGLVTGYYRKADNTRGGFLYDPNAETFTDLVPSLLTIAAGINSKGVIVGDAVFEIDPCGGPYSFDRYGWVRRTDGSVVLFQVNGELTVARGINDSGMITGRTSDPVTGESKGFVIKAPTTNCESITVDSSELFQFPGASLTWPEGITNSGKIAGFFIDSTGNRMGGFIATPQ